MLDLPDKRQKENVYDITEFAFAKEVCKSHPKIIMIYKKLLPILYQFAAYQCVFPVITMVEDSLLLAQMQYEYYKKIQDEKGKIQK